MPGLYYFSESHVCYRPIKGLRLLVILFSIVITSAVSTMVAGVFGADPFGLLALRDDNTARENLVLKAQLGSLSERLDRLGRVLSELNTSDDQLRTAVNLRRLPRSVKMASIGGTRENRDYGVSVDANRLIANATNKLEALNREAGAQSASYEDILNRYKMNQELFRHMPAIDPIRAGILTDGFGMRLHPILRVRLMHEGIDIEAEVGTPVHATGNGTVLYIGRRGGYGNVVEIDNGFGYTTLFGHLSKFLVYPGEKVKRGDVIALSGDTGLSTGPHLHYEVRKNGVHLDPSEFFFNGAQYNTMAIYAVRTVK